MVQSVVGAVGSVLGANKAANAAKDAASVQSAAANQANSVEERIFNQNQQNIQPWLTAGTQGVNKLSDLLGTSSNTGASGYGSLLKPFSTQDFQTDPGYQFALQQGQQALDRTLSRGGNVFSGAAAKQAVRYNQGMADQQFGDAYNRYNTNQSNIYSRLAGLSNTGQSAANQNAGYGQNYANQYGNNLTSGAAAQGAGMVGSANAWNTGLKGVASSLSSAFSPFGSQQGGFPQQSGLSGLNPAQLSTAPGTFFA